MPAPRRYLPGDLPPWPVACRFRSEAFVAGEKPTGGGRALPAGVSAKLAEVPATEVP